MKNVSFTLVKANHSRICDVWERIRQVEEGVLRGKKIGLGLPVSTLHLPPLSPAPPHSIFFLPFISFSPSSFLFPSFPLTYSLNLLNFSLPPEPSFRPRKWEDSNLRIRILKQKDEEEGQGWGGRGLTKCRVFFFLYFLLFLFLIVIIILIRRLR